MALGDLAQILQADPATQNGGFLDPNTIKRRQAIADALMKEGTDYSPVQSWTQGAARLAAGLNGAVQQSRLDRDAKDGTAAWQSALARALMSYGQSSPPAVDGGVSSGGSGAGVNMTAQGNAPADQMDRARERMAYLVNEKGMSPNVAAGIVGNAWHESGGLFPKVVGDNGNSFGEMQFNKAGEQPPLLAFARAQGRDPYDWKTQYDFVADRLGGPYKNVMAQMQAAADPASAALAFSSGYERPLAAAAHNDRRVKWANTAAGLIPTQQAGAPVQVASADPTQAMAYAAQQQAQPGPAQTAIDPASAPLPPPRPANLGSIADVKSDDEDETPSPNSATVPNASVANQSPSTTRSSQSPLGATMDPNKSAQLRAAMAVISNPYATPQAQQIAAMIIGNMSKQRAPVTLSAGAKLIDPATGRMIASNPKEDDGEKDSATVKDYKYYIKTLPAGQQPMPFDAWSTAKARAGAANISNNVDMNSGQTYDQQLAQGLGKAHAALSNGVEDAQARARDLAAMQGAIDSIQKNGGTTGGMGQQQALDMKKTINAGLNALGIDAPFSEADIADKEFLTKFNRQIAGAQAQGAMGSRVTNFEMANYLKANPGLEMSITGNQRLIGIQSQIEQRNIAVGNLIRQATGQAISQGQKINPLQIQKIITDYDEAHHIKDPVTGQDLTQSYALPEFQGGANAGLAASHSKNIRSMKTKSGVNWSVEQ